VSFRPFLVHAKAQRREGDAKGLRLQRSAPRASIRRMNGIDPARFDRLPLDRIEQVTFYGRYELTTDLIAKGTT
jgi:hypothetical protein